MRVGAVIAFAGICSASGIGLRSAILDTSVQDLHLAHTLASFDYVSADSSSVARSHYLHVLVKLADVSAKASAELVIANAHARIHADLSSPVPMAKVHANAFSLLAHPKVIKELSGSRMGWSLFAQP